MFPVCQKIESLVLYGCQCIVCVLVLVSLMQLVVSLPVTNGNELSFFSLTYAANSPKTEQIYMHKIYLLTRNTILIVMKVTLTLLTKHAFSQLIRLLKQMGRGFCLF